MIERALDSNNDLLIRSGSFATVTEGAQVVQHVRTRLLFYLGEWFADKRAGTAWFQEVFVKPFNPIATEAVIRSRIINTPDLKEIIEFALSDYDPATRRLSVSFSAETEYGVINNQEVFINV